MNTADAYNTQYHAERAAKMQPGDVVADYRIITAFVLKYRFICVKIN